jgi:hypothetical protein
MDITPTLNSIRTQIRTLQSTLQSTDILNPDEFGREFGDYDRSDPLSIRRLFAWGQHHVFRERLIQSEMDPERLARRLRGFDVQLQAEALNMMRDEQRRGVIRHLGDMTKQMSLWQDLESYNWPDRILPTTVVMIRGKLPQHYPESMVNCIKCGIGYGQWASAYTADCQIHSFCESCESGSQEGICTQCN